MRKNQSGTWKKTSLAVGILLPTMALAQSDFQIEEIVVTAQKRQQSLQDVPVSVSVVTGTAIAETGISNLDELSTLVPNLSITEGSQTTSITLRGLGSGINQGFEQSVGMFIDGIYAGRDRQFRSPFLDVAAVEVLRGPQGTLFGKNTIAGALNISTAKPSNEFEASLRLTNDPKYKSYGVEGIISGAITDTLQGRLALKQSESDGFINNTLLNEDEPSKVETVARATLVWSPSDELTLTAKYEIGRFDVSGEANRIDVDGGWGEVFRTIDPDFATSDDYARSTDLAEFSANDNESFTLNVDYSLGEYTLTSITGYSEYNYSDSQDVDFSPLEVLNQYQDQDFEQFSQEFRITSPLSDTFDFLAGAYYQSSSLDHRKNLDSNIGNLVGGVPAVGTFNGFPVGFNPFSVAELLAPAAFFNPGVGPLPINASASIFSTASQSRNGGVVGGGRISNFSQEAETWALYGQGDWHVRDDLQLSFGLRYAEETKDVTRDLFLHAFGSELELDSNDPANALSIGIQNGVFSTAKHSLQDGETVENLSPSVKVIFNLSDDIMVYASVSKAFKSGGYSESGTDGDVDGFHFDDEEALAFELGSKLRIFDGRGSLNLALFQTNYKDLQVSAFVGDKYVVGNAAEATSRGLEVDSVVRLTDGLSLKASMAYLDATYDEFANASCTLAQIQSSGATAKDCAQDLGGETLPFAPEWSANVGLEHFTDLNSSLELRTNLMLNYTGEQYLAQDLDIQALEESHLTLNGRVSLMNIESNWELALVGKNLTDEKIRTYANDVPLMDGAYFTYMGIPRTVAIQFGLSY